MRRAIVALFLAACPSPGGNDGGGTGGGSVMAAGGGTASTGGGSGGGGGSTGGGSAGGGTTVPGLNPNQYCSGRAAAICATRVRCGLIDASLLNVCLHDTDNIYTCTRFPQRVDAGAITWKPASAKACVDAYAAQSCDEAWANAFPAPCNDLSAPAGRLGTPCDIGECVEGGCNGRPFSAPGCATCSPFLAMGAACQRQPYPVFESVCDPSSAVCRGASDGGRTCQPIRDAGEPCGAAYECGPRRCIDQASIDGGQDTCGDLPLGARCARADDCGPAAYCQAGTCAARVAIGSTCGDEPGDDGCADGGSCFYGLCGVGGTYSRALGQTCDNQVYDQCAGGSWCHVDEDGGENGRCESMVDAGEPCETMGSGPRCARGLYCRGNLCVVPGAEGSLCNTSTAPCGALLSCAIEVDGGRVCKRHSVENEACSATANILCNVSLCVSPDGGTEGTCGPLRGAGESCGSLADCATFHCANPDSGFNGPKLCYPSCY